MEGEVVCERFSGCLNGILTGCDRYPLCYTAYDHKSRWYKVFDFCTFWERQHCRRIWLAWRIHERPAVSIELNRDEFSTQEEWAKAVYELDLKFNGPCPDGYHWVRSESFKWTPEGQYENLNIKLEAIRNEQRRG